MALMPQVRVRNVTKEYKLAAGLFTPGLLGIEERGPYSRKQRVPEDELPLKKHTGEQQSLQQLQEAKEGKATLASTWKVSGKQPGSMTTAN